MSRGQIAAFWVVLFCLTCMVGAVIAQHWIIKEQARRFGIIRAVEACDSKWNYRMMHLAVQLANGDITIPQFREFWESYLNQRQDECREDRA